jgi:Uma2 family endonuclease
MSTAQPAPRVEPSPLVEGERLNQPEFHRRYQAMPAGTRAELINGVVYMPGPVGRAHGQAHVPAVVWLDRYAEATPGVEVLDNATAILGRTSEAQPDALLRVLPECGGQTRTERGFVRGAPELVLEVAHATRYVDLGPKLDDYERAGVREYVVRALDPDEVLWHVLRDGRLVATPPAADGL